MSIRIALDNPPEFFTNQDILRGHVLFSLSRAEHVGAIVVKLEGESRTALGLPVDGSGRGVSQRLPGQATDVYHDGRRVVEVVHENHKLLYKVAQVFPDEKTPSQQAPLVLAPGQHRFPFEFKFPFNNACSDTAAMFKLGGLAGAGGFASGSGLFGLGGVRVMDGSKQLMYTHVTKTLPPSFTGYPGEAEIRYYVKVTVQRPGLFKENWRYHMGLKFQPIEPPRPQKSNQEAYARRPFVFRPRSPRPSLDARKRTSFFTGRHGHGAHSAASGSAAAATDQNPDGDLSAPGTPSATEGTPSIEVSARLPHPAILTCNKPIPLRIITKKLVPADASEVFLIALEIILIGQTHIRCQDLVNVETSRWVIVSQQGLQIPVSRPGDKVGTELVIPDSLWNMIPLPNTVMPSFVTCNLGRDYQLEVKIGLAWGKPIPASNSFFKGMSRLDSADIPQEIHLPLNFSNVQVYSGLAPPEQLLNAVRQGRGRRRPTSTTNNPNPQRPPRPEQNNASGAPTSPYQAPLTSPQQQQHPPALPPRTSTAPQQEQQAAPPYDEAPPSYEEAMAEAMTGPMIPPTARPAYSGVTNENSPSTLPEKS